MMRWNLLKDFLSRKQGTFVINNRKIAAKFVVDHFMVRLTINIARCKGVEKKKPGKLLSSSALPGRDDSGSIVEGCPTFCRVF